MTPTTSYGNWTNHGDGEVTLETNITVALGDFVDDYDEAGLAAAYRDAINANLPDDIQMCGDEFYGSYPAPEDAADTIRKAIRDVDFWALAEQYDTTTSKA